MKNVILDQLLSFATSLVVTAVVVCLVVMAANFALGF